MGSEAWAWAMICLVEVAVVAAEFGLLKWIFGNMYRQGAPDNPVTAKRAIMTVSVANAASFAFGFVVIIYLLIDVGS